MNYSWREQSLHIIAQIIDVQTVPLASGTTGRVIDGHMRISGHLRPSTRTISKRYTRHVSTRSFTDFRFQYEWFEDGYASDGTRPMHRYYFFLMACEQVHEMREMDDSSHIFGENVFGGAAIKIRGQMYVEDQVDDAEEGVEMDEELGVRGEKIVVHGGFKWRMSLIGHVHGLILECVDADSDTYRRVGVFRHMWSEGRTSMDNSKAEDYPEFVGFDPRNCERHTITIV
jgi:hypothetical protein